MAHERVPVAHTGPTCLTSQTLRSWRTCQSGLSPQARLEAAPQGCAPSAAERVCPRPQWDEVEAVGALLPQARATLPRSPVVSGAARPPRPASGYSPGQAPCSPRSLRTLLCPPLVLVCSPGDTGREVTCLPDAAQEEHGLASGCGRNLSANVSADTNTVSNPVAALSQCLHGRCVEPAFRARLGARRPPVRPLAAGRWTHSRSQVGPSGPQSTPDHVSIRPPVLGSCSHSPALPHPQA